MTTPRRTLVLRTAAPPFALKALWDDGVRSVLLEGGPTVAGAFVDAGCVDEVVALRRAEAAGGGPVSLRDAGIGTLADAVQLEIVEATLLGGDLRIRAAVIRPD